MTGGNRRRRVPEVVPEPGFYDDGPVFLRISLRTAGRRWPVPGFPREVNDRELDNDDVHDWVRVTQNSRAAYAYRDQLVREHLLPPRSVAVVRFREADAPGESPHPCDGIAPRSSLDRVRETGRTTERPVVPGHPG